MALIDNMANIEHMRASAISANQPADDRLVIVQDIEEINGEKRVVTIGARYRNGRWVGEQEKEDLTDVLTDAAIWTESYLFLPSSAGTY